MMPENLTLLESKPAKAFVQRLDPRSRARLTSVLEGKQDNLLDWSIGRALLTELKLNLFLSAASETDPVERQKTTDQMRAEVLATEAEIQPVLKRLGISEIETYKEIAAALSRLQNTLEKVSAQLGEVPVSPASKIMERPRDPFAEQFMPFEVYHNYITSKVLPLGLREEADRELSWLLSEWHKQVREHPNLPREAEQLLQASRAMALKVSFEARRICDLKPLARNATSIQPGYRSAANDASKLDRRIRKLLENAPRGEKRDQLLCLDRARVFLIKAVHEFESFLSTLPPSSRAARRFYEQSHFTYSEQAQSKIRVPHQTPLHVVVGIYGLLMILLGTLLISRWERVWGWIIFYRGKGYGSELGVTDYTVRDSAWIGKVAKENWKKFPVMDRWTLGNELMRKLNVRGFHSVEIESYDGNLLAKSIHRDQKLEWVVIPTADELERIPRSGSQTR